jgi:hypothetical protein
MRPHERLLEWFKLEDREQRRAMFDAVFSADAELDDELGVGCLRDRVYDYEDVRPIVAQGDDGGGAVVVAALDPVTGLWRRIALVFSVRDGLITKVTETSSTRFSYDDVEVSEAQLEAEQLLAEFKLRRVTGANRAEYEAVVRAVLASVQESYPGVALKKIGTLFDRPAFEAKSWWFVPFGWVGCSGHIVEKLSGRVYELGSGFPLAVWFWGHERGALQSPCTLVIDKVHDAARARDLLARPDDKGPENCVLLRGYASDGSRRWLNLAALLGKDPVKIEAASLWFVLPALKKAEVTHAFDFHIENAPPSPDLG